LPVAKIGGGSFRKLSVVSTLELDGTSSYDPDSENGKPSNAIYDWSCCELINGICDFVLGNMKFPNLENKAKIRREANEISPFPVGIFQFHLTYMVHGRKDSTFVTVEFEAGPIPTVTISSLQSSLHNWDRPLTLKGNVITTRE